MTSRNNRNAWIQMHTESTNRKKMYKAKKQWVIASATLIAMLGLGGYASSHVSTHASTVPNNTKRITDNARHLTSKLMYKSINNNLDSPSHIHFYNGVSRGFNNSSDNSNSNSNSNSINQTVSRPNNPKRIQKNNTNTNINNNNNNGNHVTNRHFIKLNNNNTHSINTSNTIKSGSDVIVLKNPNNRGSVVSALNQISSLKADGVKPSKESSNTATSASSSQPTAQNAQATELAPSNAINIKAEQMNNHPYTNTASVASNAYVNDYDKQQSAKSGELTFDFINTANNNKLTAQDVNNQNVITSELYNNPKQTNNIAPSYTSALDNKGNYVIDNLADKFSLKNGISQNIYVPVHHAQLNVKYVDGNNRQVGQAEYNLNNSDLGNLADHTDLLKSKMPNGYDLANDTFINQLEAHHDYNITINVNPKTVHVSSNDNIAIPTLSRRRYYYRRSRAKAPKAVAKNPKAPYYAPDKVVHANIKYILRGVQVPSDPNLLGEKFFISDKYIYIVCRQQNKSTKYYPASPMNDYIIRGKINKKTPLVDFGGQNNSQFVKINGMGHTQTLEEYKYNGKNYFLVVGGFYGGHIKGHKGAANSSDNWGVSIGRLPVPSNSDFINHTTINMNTIPRINKLGYASKSGKDLNPGVRVERVDAGLTSNAGGNKYIMLATRAYGGNHIEHKRVTITKGSGKKKKTYHVTEYYQHHGGPGQYTLINRKAFDKIMDRLQGKSVKKRAMSAKSPQFRKAIAWSSGPITDVAGEMPNDSFQGLDINDDKIMFIVGGATSGNKFKKDNNPKIEVVKANSRSALRSTIGKKHIYEIASSTWGQSDQNKKNGKKVGVNDIVEPEADQLLGSDVFLDEYVHGRVTYGSRNRIYAAPKDSFIVPKKTSMPTASDVIKPGKGAMPFIYTGMTGDSAASDACEIAALKMALSVKNKALQVPLATMVENSPYKYHPGHKSGNPFFAGSGASITPSQIAVVGRKYDKGNVNTAKIKGNNPFKSIASFVKKGDPVVFEGCHRMEVSKASHDHNLVALGYTSSYTYTNPKTHKTVTSPALFCVDPYADSYTTTKPTTHTNGKYRKHPYTTGSTMGGWVPAVNFNDILRARNKKNQHVHSQTFAYVSGNKAKVKFSDGSSSDDDADSSNTDSSSSSSSKSSRKHKKNRKSAKAKRAKKGRHRR